MTKISYHSDPHQISDFFFFFFFECQKSHPTFSNHNKISLWIQIPTPFGPRSFWSQDHCLRRNDSLVHTVPYTVVKIIHYSKTAKHMKMSDHCITPMQWQFYLDETNTTTQMSIAFSLNKNNLYCLWNLILSLSLKVQ